MSKTATFACATISLLAACAPSGPAAGPSAIPELAGRTPGPAQSCVPIRSTASPRIADRNHLIYSSGSTVWLNTAQCLGVTRDDILVLHPTGSQYCRGDIVATMDPVSHIRGGSCVLGDFLPYRR